MRALIVSDSHGLEQELLTIFERHQDVNAAFHCGDSQLTRDIESLYPYRVVRGIAITDTIFRKKSYRKWMVIPSSVSTGIGRTSNTV